MDIFVKIEGQTNPQKNAPNRPGFFRAGAFAWGGIEQSIDVATGMATGASRHKPMQMNRELDTATPVFFDSLLRNAPLGVTVAADTPDATGALKPSATYVMTNATVSRFALSAVRGGADTVSEEIEAVYSIIDVQHDPSLAKYRSGPGVPS